MDFGVIKHNPAAPAASETNETVEVHHAHEYHIRDLTTRSVTLFPSRARIVRDLKEVPLKVSFLSPILIPICLSVFFCFCFFLCLYPLISCVLCTDSH
jgi:hypothetical protein